MRELAAEFAEALAMRWRSPSCWFVGLHLLGLLAVALISAQVLGWLDLGAWFYGLYGGIRQTIALLLQFTESLTK